MSGKLKLHAALAVLIIVMFAGFSLRPPLATAHVLTQNNGISGVLHIPPEDNPPANTPVRLGVSFADTSNKFSLTNCDCKIILQRNGKVVKTLPIKPYFKGSSLSGLATAAFPEVGAYYVIVKGTSTDGSFEAFQLEYLVRVTGNSASNTTSVQSDAGTSVIIISLGSLVILILFAYIAIQSGPRYKSQPKPNKGKTINKRKR